MPDTTKTTMYEALLAVQKETPALQKNAINPHFKSKYISLDNLMEAILPILNKHNFVWLTFPTFENEPTLHYELVYTPSGEKIEGTMPLQARSASPQDQGSAITYARRYSLMAVLGLVADEDDDGEKAQATVAGPISESNKRAILMSLEKLGRTPEEYEKIIGGPIDKLTNLKAQEALEQLKTLLLRQAQKAKEND
jgi:hypothetical protein